MVRSAAHVAAAVDATEEGLVLLSNQQKALPFASSKATAVIGPLAAVRKTLIGNYFGQICPGLPETFNCVKTIRESVDGVLGTNSSYAAGCANVPCDNDKGFKAAVAAATAAEQVVLTLGLDGTQEGEGHDRHSVVLPGMQLQLAQAILKLKRPTVRTTLELLLLLLQLLMVLLLPVLKSLSCR